MRSLSGCPLNDVNYVETGDLANLPLSLVPLPSQGTVSLPLFAPIFSFLFFLAFYFTILLLLE
jgi:hypothetical protein